MMTLEERINYFESLFDDLMSTNSINEKRDMVSIIPNELMEDFNYILECLNGVRKFGYTYVRLMGNYTMPCERYSFNTVKELLQYMQEPYTKKDFSTLNVSVHIRETNYLADFLEPIINRTLKLGIGKSLLEKVDTSPMLAKKFEPDKTRLYDKNGIFITQKLDGNRCIAKHDGTRWHFLSRSGKEMYVNFDMSGLPTDYIYDGEVLSPLQTFQSEHLFDEQRPIIDNTFNFTSGLINRHSTNKALVYNIFDIVDPKRMYCERRDLLDCLDPQSSDIRILPVLCASDGVDANTLTNILIKATTAGAEGLMINFGSAVYENKRTDKLLKYKTMKTIDMKVLHIVEGNGKYEGMIGSLFCYCKTEDGKDVSAYVGSGLSDTQRLEWTTNSSAIVGKIVEIGYFELSQNSVDRGTNKYSLRFPRLLKIRSDKNDTSEF